MGKYKAEKLFGRKEFAEALNELDARINKLVIVAVEPSDATVNVLEGIVDNLNVLESQVEEIKEQMKPGKRGKKNN